MPVTKEALSEHNHTAASAISLGDAILCIGFMDATLSLSAGLVIRFLSIVVMVAPGQIALIRMPRPANSTADVFVNPITPCLLPE